MTALLGLLKRLLSAEMVAAKATASEVVARPVALPKEWHCLLCTYVNPYASKMCNMCAYPRKYHCWRQLWRDYSCSLTAK